MGNQHCYAQRELCNQSAEATALEFALNNHEIIRAEVTQRHRGKIVVVSRWKSMNAGRKRTGQALEFAAHQLDDIIKLLCDLQRSVNSQEPNLGVENSAQTELERVRLIAEKPRKADTKRRRGGGRHRSLTPGQIEDGIGILRNHPTMTVEAARATLCDAGINGSRSALYRLIIAPAYASGI